MGLVYLCLEESRVKGGAAVMGGVTFSGGEGDEPVFVGALTAVFPLHIVIIKAVFFFDESEIDQNIDVAHDRPAVEASAVGDRLVSGKALVGFAVAEGEKRGIGRPDRAGKQGNVAFGNLFKPDPVIFCLLRDLDLGALP